MQAWNNAYKIAKDKNKINELRKCFCLFLHKLNVIVDAQIIDINRPRKKKTGYHPLDMAVDFFLTHKGKIKNSEIVRAGCKAGFNGIGIYNGVYKDSYHLDIGERVAFWRAVKKNNKWTYDYYNVWEGQS